MGGAATWTHPNLHGAASSPPRSATHQRQRPKKGMGPPAAPPKNPGAASGPPSSAAISASASCLVILPEPAGQRPHYTRLRLGRVLALWAQHITDWALSTFATSSAAASLGICQ